MGCTIRHACLPPVVQSIITSLILKETPERDTKSLLIIEEALKSDTTWPTQHFAFTADEADIDRAASMRREKRSRGRGPGDSRLDAGKVNLL